MIAFVDTSVLIRYLTADPPEMAEVAGRVLDGSEPLVLTDAVVAETAFVLLSVYGVPRVEIVEVLGELLRKENVRVHGAAKELVVGALLLCRSSARVSFADAMLWAIARSVGTAEESAAVYTFDRRFPGEGVELRFGG